jgi:RNA polymerase sigma-70 factor (ECF subfamily)
MPVLRPIDRWFLDEVLSHEAQFVGMAARLLGDPEAARDLVQDVFLKLLASDGWSAIDHPRAYVLRMLRNTAIERIRRARIVSFRQLTEIDASDIGDESPDPFRVAAGREEMLRVQTALDSLPEPGRSLLIQRRLEGRSPTAMSRENGISLSTLEKRLARAYYLLVQALGGDRDTGDEPGSTQSRDDVVNG